MKLLRPVTLLNSASALVVGFFIIAALLAAIFIFVDGQSQNNQEIQKATDTRESLNLLFSALQDVDAAERGYMLTGNPTYLALYDAALHEVGANRDKLANTVGGEPDLRGKLSDLLDVVDEKLIEARMIVDHDQAGTSDGAYAMLTAGSGMAIMDRLRDNVSALTASRNVRMEMLLRLAQQQGVWLRIFVSAAALVILALAYISFTNVRNQLIAVTSARDTLDESNQKLIVEAGKREIVSGQLRQSQKMEALGQLTGGLAHDFNNMLAVIVSSLSLAKRRVARGEPNVTRYLDGAIDGAERAAVLTNRLLAFSRQQPLAPTSVDTNKLVGGMAELLRRSLGETVQLETVLAGGLWRTHVDSSQLENAVLNLAINARDAMPTGGNLTIETSNGHLDDYYVKDYPDVASGQYVVISITDTGTGMSPDLIEKVFDPFFTTKAPGAGTGLGLSQVYGFVKQSGGHVSIYSEPGHETVFKIYLPRAHGDDEVQKPSVLAKDIVNSCPSDVILLVEDDENVRELTVEALRELGYTVLEADGGESALHQLDDNPQIVLLFTDIVMPGMNGRDLATEALRLRPELKVLYMSGYMPNAVVHNATLGPEEALISKPFSIEQLSGKVREVLGYSSMTVGRVSEVVGSPAGMSCFGSGVQMSFKPCRLGSTTGRGVVP